MEISLTKLPWYAQIGAFVVLALAGVGAFYYYYEAPMRADVAARQTQLLALRAEISMGYATAKRLPEFRSQVAELESRLENLNAVLPSEKDAADLLRQLQTVAVAVELDDQGLQAVSSGQQTAARRVADCARARRHLPQPGDLLRSRREVHAHHHHRRARGESQGQTGAGLDDHGDLCGDDVRAGQQGEARARTGAGQAAGGEGRLVMRARGSRLVVNMRARLVAIARATVWLRSTDDFRYETCLMTCMCGTFLLLMAVAAGAQTTTTRPAPQAPERNATPDTYTYDSRGRRDPFVSLVRHRNRAAS